MGAMSTPNLDTSSLPSLRVTSTEFDAQGGFYVIRAEIPFPAACAGCGAPNAAKQDRRGTDGKIWTLTGHMRVTRVIRDVPQDGLHGAGAIVPVRWLVSGPRQWACKACGRRVPITLGGMPAGIGTNKRPRDMTTRLYEYIAQRVAAEDNNVDIARDTGYTEGAIRQMRTGMRLIGEGGK